MQALQWDGNTLRSERNYPIPKRDERAALVRVLLSGICATDLQILKGYMGFRGVPGHEFVGEVVEGPGEFCGRRVVGEINFACGTCPACARGIRRHCPHRRVMGIAGADGSFAEYLAIPVMNLHLLPESVKNEEAVFTEPLAAAFEILEQVPVQSGTEAVVFGDGKLGILCAQVLRLAGAEVRVVGKHGKKLEVLRNLGIQGKRRAEERSKSADLAVEATGSVSGLRMAMAAVRPRGTLVLKSTLVAEHTLSLADLVIQEIALVGSRCGPFEPAIRALAMKKVSVKPLIDKIYPLGEGIEAIAHAARPGTLKILLKN